jgi:hypothetical protein
MSVYTSITKEELEDVPMMDMEERDFSAIMILPANSINEDCGYRNMEIYGIDKDSKHVVGCITKHADVVNYADGTVNNMECAVGCGGIVIWDPRDLFRCSGSPNSVIITRVDEHGKALPTVMELLLKFQQSTIGDPTNADGGPPKEQD